jgi:hypothetical protein
MIREVKLVIDYGMRNLCFRPYPNHPKGCPNYGKRPTCPPKAPHIEEIIDMRKPVFAIWNVFDFGSHVKKLKEVHPDWSQRQLECCLYWQGTARKKLNEQIGFFGLGLQGHILLKCPEACGVNVTETMKWIDEILEWPPVNKAYQVAIAGLPHDPF